jgi:uncharacterized membrane protein YoaK (UPF0700 family)
MNEQEFSELMQHARLKMPFSDFEERTVARIQKERKVREASKRYRKLSWIFFLLGAVLGALGTGFINALPGRVSEPMVLACQLVYIILLLVALNYLMRGKPTSPLHDTL